MGRVVFLCALLCLFGLPQVRASSCTPLPVPGGASITRDTHIAAVTVPTTQLVVVFFTTPELKAYACNVDDTDGSTCTVHDIDSLVGENGSALGSLSAVVTSTSIVVVAENMDLYSRPVFFTCQHDLSACMYISGKSALYSAGQGMSPRMVTSGQDLFIVSGLDAAGPLLTRCDTLLVACTVVRLDHNYPWIVWSHTDGYDITLDTRRDDVVIVGRDTTHANESSVIRCKMSLTHSSDCESSVTVASVGGAPPNPTNTGFLSRVNFQDEKKRIVVSSLDASTPSAPVLTISLCDDTMDWCFVLQPDNTPRYFSNYSTALLDDIGRFFAFGRQSTGSSALVQLTCSSPQQGCHYTENPNLEVSDAHAPVLAWHDSTLFVSFLDASDSNIELVRCPALACISNPCQNGASCSSTIDGTETCACVEGYTGVHCDTLIDVCASSPCLNGGSCTQNVTTFACDCILGFSGYVCSTNVTLLASTTTFLRSVNSTTLLSSALYSSAMDASMDSVMDLAIDDAWKTDSDETTESTLKTMSDTLLSVMRYALLTSSRVNNTEISTPSDTDTALLTQAKRLAQNTFLTVSHVLKPQNMRIVTKVNQGSRLAYANECSLRVLSVVEACNNVSSLTAGTLSATVSRISSATNLTGLWRSRSSSQAFVSVPSSFGAEAGLATRNQCDLSVETALYETSPFPIVAADALHTPLSVASPVLSFAINSDSPIENLSDAASVLITLPISSISSATTGTPQCYFWSYRLQGWSRDGCVKTAETPTSITCRCSHLTNFAVLFDPTSSLDASSSVYRATEVLSWISCIVSSLGCLGFLIMYSVLPQLRSFSVVFTMHLCVALIGVNILVVAALEQTAIPLLCRSLKLVLYYFLVAAFLWMLTIAVYIYRTLERVPKETRTQRRTIVLLVWVLSLVPPIIVAVIDTVIGDTTSSTICWFGTQTSLLAAFVIPLGVILLFNVIILALSLRIFYQSFRARTSASLSRRRQILMHIRVGALLAVTVGATWVAAYVALAADVAALWLLFTILNGCQGVVIFAAYCLPKRVRREFRLVYASWRSERDSQRSKSSGHHQDEKHGKQKSKEQQKKDHTKSKSKSKSKSKTSETTSDNHRGSPVALRGAEARCPSSPPAAHVGGRVFGDPSLSVVVASGAGTPPRSPSATQQQQQEQLQRKFVSFSRPPLSGAFDQPATMAQSEWMTHSHAVRASEMLGEGMGQGGGGGVIEDHDTASECASEWMTQSMTSAASHHTATKASPSASAGRKSRLTSYITPNNCDADIFELSAIGEAPQVSRSRWSPPVSTYEHNPTEWVSMSDDDLASLQLEPLMSTASPLSSPHLTRAPPSRESSTHSNSIAAQLVRLRPTDLLSLSSTTPTVICALEEPEAEWYSSEFF